MSSAEQLPPHLEHDNTSHPPTRGITEIFDSDVLCGRGGAALRHPGNQTYRRLVNLNKGLYTTCLKTEKLKISRSIVAAIREQKGRFLEKESEGSWYDIGDKKAIEKTSQALREGQPKLRQKIVEMGGVAAMESQYGHPGLYPEQVGLVADPSLMQMPTPAAVVAHSQQQHPLHQLRIQNQAQQVAVAAAQNAVLRQGHIQSMQQLPHPDSRRLSMHEELFKRLSLRELQSQEEQMQQHRHQQSQQHYDRAQIQHPHLQSQQQIYQQQQLYQQQLQQQRTSNSDISMLSLGSIRPDSDRSLLSVDSTLGRMLGGSLSHLGQQHHPQTSPSGPIGSEYYHGQPEHRQQQQQQDHGQQQHDVDDMNISEHQPAPARTKLEDKLAQDRRRVYARMKYNPSEQYSNKASGGGLPASSNHSMGDGMPDFHMVESSLSLYSNLSAMTDGKSEQTKPSTVASLSNHLKQHPKPETVKVIDHSALGNNKLDRGSGHSLMSVSSIDSNFFADFRKGMSSHSIGDISILNKMDRAHEEEDDTDGFGNRLEEGGAIL